MRQVPAARTPVIAIVGDGRVARRFCRYLHLVGCPVHTSSRRASAAPPTEELACCAALLLLIRDAAIVPFIEAWPALGEKQLVHCSGALVTDVAEAAHPLMTFGQDLYDLETYRAILFLLDAGGTPFHLLLPGLPNAWFTIPVTDRPCCHALCMMADRFSSLLWLKLFDELQNRFAIPSSAARPYLAQVAANLSAEGSRALTGPFSRGDDTTIAANLKSLEGDPFQAVYQAFARIHARRS